MSKVQSHSGIAKAIFEFGHKASTVIILVDGSASVPQHGFETMVHTVRTIINRLPVGKNSDQCVVALVQYSSNVKVECQLTSDLLQFHNALLSMTQVYATNNEEHALTTCIKMFEESGREGARLIIHLTDGGLKGNWKVESNLAKVQHKITIISIGIGENIDAENIRLFASPGLAYFIKDYDELQEFFQFLDLSPLPSPKIKENFATKTDSREIVVELQDWSLAHDTAYYHVEVRRDDKNEQWQRIVSCQEPTILVKGLQPQTTYLMHVIAEMKSGRTTPPSNEIKFTTLPECPYHQIASDKKQLFKRVQEELQDLKKFKFLPGTSKMGIKKLRVLICGVPGAGKTSLISALASIAAGRFVESGARGESSETLTRVVSVVDSLDPIFLIDSPGINDKNATVYEKHLYYGGLSVGYDESAPDPNLIRPKEKVPIEEQVHCVVLMLSVEQLVNESLLELTKKQYRAILDNRRSALILLSKADKCDPRISLSRPETIHLIYESGLVYHYRKSLATIIGIAVDNVLPVVSYDAPPAELNPWISLLHLDWLKKAVILADSFCNWYFDVNKHLIVAEQKATQPMTVTDKMRIAEILEKEKNEAQVTLDNNIDTGTASNTSNGISCADTTTSNTNTSADTNTVIASTNNIPQEIQIFIQTSKLRAMNAYDTIYFPTTCVTFDMLKRRLCQKYSISDPTKLLVFENEIGNNASMRLSCDEDVQRLVESIKEGRRIFLTLFVEVNSCILL
jgi:uncharacterized protein YegL